MNFLMGSPFEVSYLKRKILETTVLWQLHRVLTLILLVNTKFEYREAESQIYLVGVQGKVHHLPCQTSFALMVRPLNGSLCEYLPPRMLPHLQMLGRGRDVLKYK